MFDRKVKFNIRYSKERRNLLDIYCPIDYELKTEKMPVVICLFGGAWTIGYKGFSAIMGKFLTKSGVIYIAPDYRNFP